MYRSLYLLFSIAIPVLGFAQAARAERLPAPAGARVVITEKAWIVH